MSFDGPIVLKLGGSLYDLPDLATRLGQFLASLNDGRVVLVPGGGALADVVRHFDEIHQLGEEAAHWLALRAVSLNAFFISRLLAERRTSIVATAAACAEAWRHDTVPILDAYRFATEDDGRPGCLHHCWRAGTDCLALRVAALFAAKSLILLKSRTIAENSTWHEAARSRRVDALFPQTLAENAAALASSFQIASINLREWQP
jgi:aspartokinase-like uncharacterized kinase